MRIHPETGKSTLQCMSIPKTHGPVEDSKLTRYKIPVDSFKPTCSYVVSDISQSDLVNCSKLQQLL